MIEVGSKWYVSRCDITQRYIARWYTTRWYTLHGDISQCDTSHGDISHCDTSRRDIYHTAIRHAVYMSKGYTRHTITRDVMIGHTLSVTLKHQNKQTNKQKLRTIQKRLKHGRTKRWRHHCWYFQLLSANSRFLNVIC